MGALARLCAKNPIALRHFFQERVVGLFLHSLPYLPPSTAASWRQVNGVAAFAARLCLNDWELEGRAACELAGIPWPSELCIQQGLTFLYAALRGLRSSAHWLHFAPPPQPISDTAASLRSAQACPHPWSLVVPATHLASLQPLQPRRLAQLFNALPLHEIFPLIPGPLKHPPPSSASFSRAISQAIPRLPPDLAIAYGLPPLPSPASLPLSFLS